MITLQALNTDQLYEESVGNKGIEPSILIRQISVIPLNQSPWPKLVGQKGGAVGNWTPDFLMQTKYDTISLRPLYLLRIELRLAAWKAAMQP